MTEQIIDLIKNKELKPGDKLPPERELAEKLSISRGSLREAFRVLESRGLIESNPGGGRFIRETSKEDIFNTRNIIFTLEKSSILELLEARETFEIKTVELSIRRGTKKDIEKIEEAFNNLNIKKLLKKREKDNEIIITLDTEFHLAIARASHNFVFVNIIKFHHDLLKNTRKNAWQIPGRLTKQKEEHREIFQGIKERDIKKATEAMLIHLNNIKKAIQKI